MNFIKKYRLLLSLLVIISLCFTISPAVYSSEIHEAAKAGNLAQVKELINQGADINSISGYKETVLHYAAESGNLELVQWLVNRGANLNALDNDEKSIMHSAAESGNLRLVQWLIKQGFDINAKDYLGKTSLHYAAENKRWELVRWLIEQGCDVNERDKTMKTALHFAAQSGNLEIVKWLVENGADVNAKTEEYGGSILDSAIQETKNWEMVKWLLDHGADAPHTFYWLKIWFFNGCPSFSVLSSLMIQDRLFVIIIVILILIPLLENISIPFYTINSTYHNDLVRMLEKINIAICSLQNNSQNSANDDAVNNETASPILLQQNENEVQKQD